MIDKLEVKKNNLNFDREKVKVWFENWFLATQTDWSILVSFDQIQFLALATVNKNPDPNKDFLPLMVDFREMFYSSWKIWWAPYRRKEWRPSDEAVLVSRIIDRCLRPMFPSGMINDIILTINTFQIDKKTQFQVPAIIASSLALMIAWVEFEWPVWAVTIWFSDWNFLINPKSDQNTSMNLTIAWTKDTITMIESDGEDIPADILVQAIDLAQEQIKFICEKQEEFLSKLQIKKIESTINTPSSALLEWVQNIANEYEDKFFPSNKEEFGTHYDEIITKTKEKFAKQLQDWEITENDIKSAVFKSVKKLLRYHLLKTWQRIDGRHYNQVRPLYTEVWMFERIHGTWLFQRWETQVLSFTTLWAPWKSLLKDTLELDDAEEKFMHHYYMLPYSTNEARAYRWQWRREIWHGFLAEKWLRPILPDPKIFPYTIRIASEVLSSNGSTSMASLCASCLSMMDAWVPIKKPVSGIAMGLVIQEISPEQEKEFSQNKNLQIVEIDWKRFWYMILTDLQWQEDFTWDMDFKIAWSADGINALQMDMKVKWLPSFVLQQAIQQWNEARKEILNFMLQTIEKPREKTSDYAPKITVLKLSQDNVRKVIWKWWETIKNIIEKTGVAIDFEDDWTTIITSSDAQGTNAAIEIINEITWEPKIWDIIDWKITRLEAYWVFVDLGRWKTWLCHVRNLSKDFIKDVNEHFKIWDLLKIQVTNIKEDGKVEIKAVN